MSDLVGNPEDRFSQNEAHIAHVISPRGHVLLLNIGLYRTSDYVVVKRHHKNVRMTSVLFKMAYVNAGYFKVKLNLFERSHPKVCKKKNPTLVCG